ncbi:MAG: hypothetical protein JSV03_14665 [Planctomycetota bacterium]|nr:MAG: hypothetical protein JSV03_14665 [Planctomycetota bacterium]
MAELFTFRFETMLKIRKQREDQQKQIVSDRLRQIGQINEQITSLQRQIEQELETMRADQHPGTIDIQQAIRHRYWLCRLNKGVLESEARLRYHEAYLAQERAQLVEAAKQRRMLERLKESQFTKYQRQQVKRLTEKSDDMATVRYVLDRASAFEPVAT